MPTFFSGLIESRCNAISSMTSCLIRVESISNTTRRLYFLKMSSCCIATSISTDLLHSYADCRKADRSADVLDSKRNEYSVTTRGSVVEADFKMRAEVNDTIWFCKNSRNGWKGSSRCLVEKTVATSGIDSGTESIGTTRGQSKEERGKDQDQLNAVATY